MPAEPPGVWTEPLRIRSYDVDVKRVATLEAICRYFMEAAWNHAEALGVGFSHLAQNNQLWVLSRFLVILEGYPRWGDSVTLQTWPREARGALALRDFELLETNGAVAAAGTSAWLVLDATSRRPQRAQKLLGSIKIAESRSATGREPAKLPALDSPAPVIERKSNYSDVDLNGHVNSARYVGWLLDSYPLEWHASRAVKSLEVNYLGETRGGETLDLLTHEHSNGEFSHAIFKRNSGEVCRARLCWTQHKTIDTKCTGK